MITIMRFEWIRKRKRVMAYWLVPVVLMLCVFVMSLLIERFVPKFNTTYMKWPDILRDFLCIGGWSRHLWMNFWQLMALFFPFYLIITMMRETAASIVEEKRLETTVYVNNAGIPKLALPAAKLLFWGGVSLITCVFVTLAGVLSAMVLQYSQGISRILTYGGRLAGVLVVYLPIALFMAVCRERACDGAIVNLILYPWLISRISVFLCFFSELLVMTGREGLLIELSNAWGEKLRVLEILSPVVWTFPATQLRGIYGTFSAMIFIIMLSSAFAIYNKKNLV